MQILRLRVGTAVVAVLQAAFWGARVLLELPVVAVPARAFIVVGGIVVVALTYTRVVHRWGAQVGLLGGSLLAVAQCGIAVAQGSTPETTLATTLLLFGLGAVATSRLEMGAYGAVTVLALAVLVPLYGWPVGRPPVMPALLMLSAMAGGLVVSSFRLRSQALLTREIARREQLEGELRATGVHLELILNATSEAILGIQLGPDGPRVTFANRRFGALFGCDPASLVGRDESAVRAVALSRFGDPAAYAQSLGWVPELPDDILVTEFALDGDHPAVIEGWSGPMVDPFGSVIGRIWVLRDVTAQRGMARERERYATRLEASNADLARASRAKDAFLANLSHELRTPLSVIIGYLNLVLEGDLSREEVREFVARCTDSAKHQLDLISDMLDLTRLEAGTAELAVVAVPVRQVVAEVHDLTQLLAHRKGLALAVHVEGDLDVLADRARLKQVLLNLVGNALKFTTAGSVTVSARADRGAVQFAVRDTGRGVPREQQGLLFQKFMQLEGRPRRAEEGVGLGLSICRELVTLMGGSIELRSPGLGHGTEVVFTLPRAAGAARPGAAP